MEPLQPGVLAAGQRDLVPGHRLREVRRRGRAGGDAADRGPRGPRGGPRVRPPGGTALQGPPCARRRVGPRLPGPGRHPGRGHRVLPASGGAEVAGLEAGVPRRHGGDLHPVLQDAPRPRADAVPCRRRAGGLAVPVALLRGGGAPLVRSDHLPGGRAQPVVPHRRGALGRLAQPGGDGADPRGLQPVRPPRGPGARRPRAVHEVLPAHRGEQPAAVAGEGRDPLALPGPAQGRGPGDGPRSPGQPVPLPRPGRPAVAVLRRRVVRALRVRGRRGPLLLLPGGAPEPGIGCARLPPAAGGQHRADERRQCRDHLRRPRRARRPLHLRAGPARVDPRRGRG